MKTHWLSFLMALTFLIVPLRADQSIQFTKGGIKAGTIISMKVTDKVDVQGKIPAWIPKLRRGQKVKFQIAKDGDLILLSPKFRFDFVVGNKYSNSYTGPNLSKGNTVRNSTALLRKKTPYNKAAIALVFEENKLNSDFTVSYVGMAYTLE